ncbi:hypothetical protein CDAR_166931 [Caerostris darwini]|uniref:SEFIR domain-containing protein n=1 Tax=Caerostris darwini TaxID=1538125 RepID=A0AAV4UEQ2_9ARAC|nr:hypothetical protein CDAR_166931 [Caerostris darwini]
MLTASLTIVINSTTIECAVSPVCPMLVGTDSTCATLSSNQYFHIGLKGVTVKQENEDTWIQLKLTSSFNFRNKDLVMSSFFIRISFVGYESCYEFIIPFSFFIHLKGDFILPCIKLQPFNWNHLIIYMSVHQEDMEMVFLQATNYSLKNVTKVNEFRGNVFNYNHAINKNNFYLTLRTKQHLYCVFNYNISIYKSSKDHMCDTNALVHRWSFDSKKSRHTKSCNRSLLTTCQKYCVYAIFTKHLHCDYTHPNSFIEISFFQLSPKSIDLKRESSPKSIDLERKISPKSIDLERESSSKSIDLNALFPEESKYSCENWSLTLDYASVKQDTFKKEITVKISLWDEYIKCFDFYNVYLYKFEYFECKPKRGIVQPDFFRINPKFNKNYSIEEIFVFPIKKSGYYCILVVPFIERTPLRTWALNSDIFNITVENISSTEIDDVNIKKTKRQNFPNEVILAICILLFITTCSLWSCFKVILKTKIKKGVDFSAYAEENLPILTQIVDKVYIFHSLDDHSIQNDVALLKNFLQECALLNVYTLDDMIHDLLEQRHCCISKILECDCPGTGKFCVSNKKFIIVISERVLRNANSEDIISDHIEERAFQMILDFTAADWKNSYCHLFVVSFNENLFYDKRFKYVVPKHIQEVKYVIPKNLINLCVNLGCSPVKKLEREELIECLHYHDIRNVGL